MESLNPLRNAEDTEMPPNRGEGQGAESRLGKRQGWSCLSDAALQRVWDNEEDAVYDNWRALHGYFTTVP
jgi:hypothetical protein